MNHKFDKQYAMRIQLVYSEANEALSDPSEVRNRQEPAEEAVFIEAVRVGNVIVK